MLVYMWYSEKRKVGVTTHDLNAAKTHIVTRDYG